MSTRTADYWHGQRDAFAALAGVHMLGPGLQGWAEAEAYLAEVAWKDAENSD